MKVTAIIIDDDLFIATVLRDILVEHYPKIEVAGVAHSGVEGLQLIEAVKPDLIFLDVEMPDMNGFEMLFLLKSIQFQIIFITAHSHYAIKAIRFNALDYLLKPIDPKELRQAIGRFKSYRQQQPRSKRVELALFNLQQSEVGEQVLLLQLQDGEVNIKLRDIAHIEGERNYSYLYLANGARKLSAKNLAYFEDILTDKGFFRCHKSHIINGVHIDTLQKEVFLLKNEEMEIPISRRRKKAAKEWFAGLQEKR